MTGDARNVPAGVFLYTGAGGGGPPTDLYVSSVETAYQSAGVSVQQGTTLPAGFATQFGVLQILNPLMAVPPEVADAALTLVESGMSSRTDSSAWSILTANCLLLRW